MRTSWIISIALLWVVGMFISDTIESQFFSAESSSLLWQAIHPQFGSFSNPLTAIGGFFIMAWNYVQIVWAMLTWDYSFLKSTATYSNPFEFLRVLGWTLSFGFVLSIILAIRGTGSN